MRRLGRASALALQGRVLYHPRARAMGGAEGRRSDSLHAVRLQSGDAGSAKHDAGVVRLRVTVKGVAPAREASQPSLLSLHAAPDEVRWPLLIDPKSIPAIPCELLAKQREALRLVLFKTGFSGVRIGEDLQMILVVNLPARVDINENCHWSLFGFGLP